MRGSIAPLLAVRPRRTAYIWHRTTWPPCFSPPPDGAFGGANSDGAAAATDELVEEQLGEMLPPGGPTRGESVEALLAQILGACSIHHILRAGGAGAVYRD